MKGWILLILLCTFVNSLCCLVDRFLMNRHKGTLHKFLYRVWIRLDETSIPQLHRVVAEAALHLVYKLTGRSLMALRSVLVIAAMSSILTLFFCTIGLLLGGFPLESVSKFGFIPMAFVVIVNLPFDILTCSFTVVALRIARKSSTVVALAVAVLDILAAYMLAILCLASFWYAQFKPMSFCEFLGDAFELIGPSVFWEEDLLSYRPMCFMFASTTLIPTALYLSMLLLAVLAKPMLDIGKRVAMYFCEKATEVDDAKELVVFSLLGGVFSAAALFAKVVVDVCNLFP